MSNEHEDKTEPIPPLLDTMMNEETIQFDDNRSSFVSWRNQFFKKNVSVCQHGIRIRRVLQSGGYIHVQQYEGEEHLCTFRGKLTTDIERHYNEASTD